MNQPEPRRSESESSRLVVVSNRLPFAFTRNADRHWTIKPGSGGLVTALLPVLRDRGGLWIGWTGAAGELPGLDAALDEAAPNTGYALKPVSLTPEEVERFYYGFSNEIMWPLFHDLQSHCNFDPDYWRTYQRVNRKYAQVIADHTRRNDFIWVHDYHLTHVGAELRHLGVRSKTGFFLHIPFPSLDIFLKLPWRFELLDAMLAYDLIGLQTLRDRRNFVQCLRALVKDVTVQGKGQVLTVKLGDREVRVGSFPISIDYQAFAEQAGAPEVGRRADELRTALNQRQLILGVDRLDYTKGIPHRLRAFRSALHRHPELREHVTLIQVVVPSREDIREYHDLKEEIERLVGEINGEFTRPGGWVPIHYVFRSLDKTELLAYYRAAQIALITPLKDGMNLVAKEYCACSIEEDCVLILSEFAGAAVQLQRDALLVNPYDIEQTADTLYHAYGMAVDERRARMRRLRKSVHDHDIFWWVDSFLRAAISKDLSAFPLPDDYVPRYRVDTLSV
ncbi:MAG TPA: trehalose-6-phosphate synthase [Acidiferrobacterales bacterium]